jgi:2'-5' RNA ligase
MPRLFYALWPDAAVRDELYAAAQTLRRDCGGRVTRRENLHQTLVFLGEVADARIARVQAIASAAAAPAFKLDFGVCGYWPHNRIVWAAPNSTPEPLTGLVAMLEQELTRAEFAYDRRPYAPHITLIRGARRPASMPALRFDWPVNDFVLVDAGGGPRGAGYRVVARWPLTG